MSVTTPHPRHPGPGPDAGVGPPPVDFDRVPDGSAVRRANAGVRRRGRRRYPVSRPGRRDDHSTLRLVSAHATVAATASRTWVVTGSGTSWSRDKNSRTATTRSSLRTGTAHAPRIPTMASRCSGSIVGSTETLGTHTSRPVWSARPASPSPFEGRPRSISVSNGARELPAASSQYQAGTGSSVTSAAT